MIDLSRKRVIKIEEKKALREKERHLTEKQKKKREYNQRYAERLRLGLVEEGKRGRKRLENPTEAQKKRQEYSDWYRQTLKATGKKSLGRNSTTIIEGTNIKVSKIVYTKFKKGQYSLDTLKKNILKKNQVAGPTKDGSQLKNVKLEQILKTNENIKSNDLILKEIRTQWRSSTAKMNKDLVVRSVVDELKVKSLSNQEQAELNKLLNQGQWHWNYTTKRFENGEGGWITINEHKGDYSHKSLDWGTN